MIRHGHILPRYLVLALILGGLLLTPSWPPVAAQSPVSLVVWSNDHFSSDIRDPSLVNGSTFVIDILANNLPPINGSDGGINGFDIKISFNPSVLMAIELDWQTPLCPSSEGCLFDTSSTFSPAKEIQAGSVRLTVVLLGAAAVTGFGTLFRIRFQVVGSGGSLLDIQENVSTIVGPVGGDVVAIPYESTDGSFSNLTGELQPPVAVFTHFPPSPAINDYVVFDASASYDPDFLNATNNGIVSYQWNFGDGTSTALESPVISHPFFVDGSYIVTLTVVDLDGLEGFATETILVQPQQAHDLAILSVSLIPSNVPRGQEVIVQVTVQNRGNSSEVSTLRVFVDGFEQTIQTEFLPAATFVVVDIHLFTSGLSEGYHTVLVSIDAVQGEANLGDNSLTTILTVTPPESTSVYTRIDLPHEFIQGGTPLGIHGIDQTVLISLPFQFEFYGNTFTSIWASTNGLVTPFGPDPQFSNSQAGLRMKFAIAPLWDDMVTSVRTGDDLYTLSIDATHFMIRWQAAYTSNPGVEINFEVILGADGNIQFNYGPSNGMISATVGISNGSGDAITEDVSFIDNRASILFLPFKPEHDLAVSLQTPEFIPSGGSALITATAVNQGTSNETDISLELLIDGVQVNATTIPVLAGNASSVSVSYYWTPASLGDHTVKGIVSIVPGENFTANNEATVVANVREPLIRPQTGQYAEYEATNVNPGGVQTAQIRIDYGEYISTELIEVTITVHVSTEFNYTLSQRINVFTREVFDQYGPQGYWFGWIETDIGVGSDVNLGFPASVVAREAFVTSAGVIDAWRLESPYPTPGLNIWYDSGVGVLVGYNSTIELYSINSVLVATNIPLTTLRVHEVSLNPTQGPVGTQITVFGSDAEAGHEFEIRWDGQVLGTVMADSQETFTFTFNAPPSPAGPHTVMVTDLATGFHASAVFTIVPSILIDPAAGPVGTLVLVHGSGMPARTFMAVNFDGQTFATVVTDGTGSFSASLLVPHAEPGDHMIQAQSLFAIIFPDEPGPAPSVLASAVFTVIDETALAIVADTGAVYFPSDSADVFIQVSFHGSPVDPAVLTVKLWKPDGTSSELTTTRLGIGLYTATISVPRATGTYMFEVEATYQTHSADAHGSTIDVFEVKPGWLSDRSRTMITVTGSILATMAAAGVVLYRTRRKAEDSAALPF